MTTPDPYSHDTQLDALVAHYIEAIERGETPDREKLIAENPALADGVRRFFTDYDRLQLTNLQPAAQHVNPEATFIPQHEPQPGTIFGGRYKLLQNIGEGGMGSVWVAEQKQPVRRKVAIKLVKAGMDSKQVLARFEAERQALAMMDHPNIAKVFDGGITEHGRPYFVMEYVKGVPFTEYCDKARLSLKERLNLFIPVCQAVQHAHHKGIVHRDLKPSNILICLYDGKPVPKVIDFGLAKAMHQQLTEQSIFTAHGVMVGTPLYMSPEQAEHNNLDVDTRTDIYSLGVVLYELLTGTTPLEREQLRTAAYNEVLRLIKEVEPPRPSTRLSGSDSLPSIAAQRSIDPRHLQKSVAGDLDWIVMKSLEKERSRRYETANGLVRDIERFLNDEAVEACPPSRIYQVKKYLKKHKLQTIASFAVFLAMGVGTAAASWGWFQATEAEKSVLKSLADVTKERDAKKEALSRESAALASEAAQRDLAERELIEGILRPIGYGNELETAELRSFIDWSAISDSRLKLRVLEIAFEDPATALRVARRAERAIQACVALSPNRRAKAIELFSAKQRDINADPRIRIGACWLAMELGSADLPTLAEGIGYLRHEKYRGTELKEFIAFAVNRNDAKQQMQIRHQLPNALLAELTNQSGLDWEIRYAACDALITLADRIEPTQIERFGDAVTEIAERLSTAHLPSKVLVKIAPRLHQWQQIRAWNALTAIVESNDHDESSGAISGIIAIVPFMDQSIVEGTADKLIAKLEAGYGEEHPHTLVEGIMAFSRRLQSTQLTRFGNALIVAFDKAINPKGLEASIKAFTTISPMLETPQVIRAADAMTTLLRKDDEFYEAALPFASEGFIALAPRLEPSQILRGWDAMIVATANDHSISVQLPKLAALLQPTDVVVASDAILELLDKSNDEDLFTSYVTGLGALTPKMNPEQLDRVFMALATTFDRIVDGPNPRASEVVVDVLGEMIPLLNPLQVARVQAAVRILVEHPTAGVDLKTVVAILPPLEPAMAEHLFQLASDNDDPKFESLGLRNGAIARAIVYLAPQLDPTFVMPRWDQLITVLNQRTFISNGPIVEQALTVLSHRIPPEQIAHAADSLINVLENSSSLSSLQAASNGLLALAPRLASEKRVRAAEAMVESLHRVEWGRITEQIAKLVPLLDPPNQDLTSTRSMVILNDKLATSSTYFDHMGNRVYDPLRSGTTAMINARSMGQLMQHPACIGEPRAWMLQRFEELVFYDGNSVFLNLPEEDCERQGQDENPSSAIPAANENEHGGLTPNRSPAEPPPRRFHTVHDAAAWIQQNWPDFDLEATHPVTWRGEM